MKKASQELISIKSYWDFNFRTSLILAWKNNERPGIQVVCGLTPHSALLYHGNKADIAKRLNSEELLPEQDDKSAIILEMTPIVHAASCSTGIENFSDSAVIIYHHVPKLSHV